jgi:hypothetical protein
MRGYKLRSGVNWLGALIKKNVKQNGYKRRLWCIREFHVTEVAQKIMPPHPYFILFLFFFFLIFIYLFIYRQVTKLESCYFRWYTFECPSFCVRIDKGSQ